jgi:limonene-1,2-epoxide hydrolase
MARKRVFISFDYDHDVDLKNALVAQSRLPDSPFEITDMSIKTASPGWQADARRRIRGCDVVVVMCGQYTHTATGVGVEVKIAQEERESYFLLHGRADKTCTKPTTAKSTDAIYEWTWPNLKRLIGGVR